MAAISSIGQSDTLNQVDSIGRKQDYWKIYGPNKTNSRHCDTCLREEGGFLKGRKMGRWIYYFEDGKSIKTDARYWNSRPDGHWINYYRNGEIKSEEDFVKGRLKDEKKPSNKSPYPWTDPIKEERVFIMPYYITDSLDFGWKLTHSLNTNEECDSVYSNDNLGSIGVCFPDGWIVTYDSNFIKGKPIYHERFRNRMTPGVSVYCERIDTAVNVIEFDSTGRMFGYKHKVTEFKDAPLSLSNLNSRQLSICGQDGIYSRWKIIDLKDDVFVLEDTLIFTKVSFVNGNFGYTIWMATRASDESQEDRDYFNWIVNHTNFGPRKYYPNGEIKQNGKRRYVEKNSVILDEKTAKLESPSFNNCVVRDTNKISSNGYYKLFNENMEICIEGEFKAGKLWNGKHYHYDGDGILMKVEAWKNGKFSGYVPF